MRCLFKAGLITFLTSVSAFAQSPLDLPLSCWGAKPEWQLDVLTENEVRFRFAGRDTRFEIPQQSAAEGRDWPYAMTLVARNDTAILLFEEEYCTPENENAPIRLHVFTQRGETPILLTGCCHTVD